jgi:hypothetical protein
VKCYGFLDVGVEFIHGLALGKNVRTDAASTPRFTCRYRPQFLQALQFLVPFMLSRSSRIFHLFIGGEACEATAAQAIAVTA